MHPFSSDRFEQLLPRLLEFEAKSFGDFPYTPAPERLRAWHQANSFFLSGTLNQQSDLQDLFTALITTPCEYEKFRDGQLASSKQMLPHPGDKTPAVIYITTLIVTHRPNMPFLFKNLTSQINRRLELIGSSAEAIVATAADKRAIFLMKRFGFEQTALYQDGYKIMRATRQSSSLFRHIIR